MVYHLEKDISKHHNNKLVLYNKSAPSTEPNFKWKKNKCIEYSFVFPFNNTDLEI